MCGPFLHSGPTAVEHRAESSGALRVGQEQQAGPRGEVGKAHHLELVRVSK